MVYIVQLLLHNGMASVTKKFMIKFSFILLVCEWCWSVSAHNLHASEMKVLLLTVSAVVLSVTGKERSVNADPTEMCSTYMRHLSTFVAWILGKIYRLPRPAKCPIRSPYFR